MHTHTHTPVTMALCGGNRRIAKACWPPAYFRFQWQTLSQTNKTRCDRAGHPTSSYGFSTDMYAHAPTQALKHTHVNLHTYTYTKFPILIIVIEQQ